MRIVLDTNQLIRALMRSPELATFMMAWEARRFVVVCSAPLLDEYQNVLARPEITPLIYPELRRLFSKRLQPDLEMIELKAIPNLCRDPKDDKVIATAVVGMVDFLVTADEDILVKPIADLLAAEGIGLCTIDDLLHML